MKKLVACGLMGAMLMASQGVAFAGGEKVEAKMVKSVATTAAVIEATEIKDGMKAATLVAAEVDKEAVNKKIKEICDTLKLDYKALEGKSFGEVLDTLTEAQINELAKADVIHVMEAVAITENATTGEISVEKDMITNIAVKMSTPAEVVKK